MMKNIKIDSLFGWVRSLYDWVLHWADSPYGVPALIILSFTEASFFPRTAGSSSDSISCQPS